MEVESLTVDEALTRAATGTLELVLRFAQRLRMVGIGLSMGQVLDAVAAVRHIDLASRDQFRTALGATLVKRYEDCELFDALFDASFPARRVAATEAARQAATAGRAAPESDQTEQEEQRPDARVPSDDMMAALLRALNSDDQEGLRALADLAVQRYGGLEGAEATRGHRYFMYRVLRSLDLSNLLHQAVREERASAQGRTRLEDRLRRDDQARRIEDLRRMISEEIRGRLAPDDSDLSLLLGETPIEDVDFLESTKTQRRQIRYAVQPLARRLATRIAQRRRRRTHGHLDVRRTIRKSLSSGGVPLEPCFKRPHVSKPDLVLLCDVSGSVAEFSAFTLAFLHAIHDEFHKVRSFAFIDGVDEVTELVAESARTLDPRHLLSRVRVIWSDGHSDYGNVLDRFWDRYSTSLSSKTTLIVTGDARSNYRPGSPGTLRSIRTRVRRVYWLNPEPRSEWDTLDSILSEYTPHCDGVFEVRNLRQLAECVYELV